MNASRIHHDVPTAAADTHKLSDKVLIDNDCRYTSAAPVSDDALEHKRRDDVSHDDRE